MLGFLFETVGKGLRGVVDLTTEVITEVVEAPSSMLKGYQEGFKFESSSSKDEHEKTTETEDTPSFARKGAA
jgi:hypothetical protein